MAGQSLGAAAPVKTLTELRNWNIAHAAAGAIKYGQSQLDISDEMDVETRPRALRGGPRQGHRASPATHGIDEVMKAHQLDALLFPGPQRRGHRRQARLPDRDRSVRDGAERADAGLSRGVRRRSPRRSASASPAWPAASRGCSRSAYAFEQATKRRVPPPSAP